jgi:hypothetical protein
VLPALLVLLAAYADSRGSYRVAFDALLVAVPLACVAALSSFAVFLGRRADAASAFHALGWLFVVLLLVLSCAMRSAALHGLPALAVSSVVACLGIFATQVGIVVAPFVRRLAALRPAKP